MKTMLIVDDDRGSRESLRQTFSRLYHTRLAENAAAALRELNDHPVDIVMLDVMMPEKDGVTLLKELNELHPGLPCVMVSASPAVRPVVEAMKAGAGDFVIKPFDVEEIRRIVARVIETSALRRRVVILQDEVSREHPTDELVGQAPAFLETLTAVQQASTSNATVLIQGESGTGKELIARRLHRLSPRADEPFIPIHCSALPETLMESELFGHEKGAFTGADTRKMGRFDLAGSGTLFFDEVGEMSLAMQVKLLRVLQEREYMRLGGTQVIKTHARIITATSRILEDEIRLHRFRDDLYYRLNVIPITLPPLRKRMQDIPLLARHFLRLFRQSMNHSARDFSAEAVEKLAAYSWPGNIRELRNIVERTLVLHGKQELIVPGHLPEFIQGRPVSASPARREGIDLESAISACERELILNALRESKGNQTRAARALGTTRRILGYKMAKLSLSATS
jgi:DNA-binding NtrC family response regulator